MFKKENILFIVLGGFFICNAIIAEFIGVKIFSLENTLGLPPLNLEMMGGTYSFNLTAGVLLWPVVFIMTDIINEYYGMRGVRLLSWMAAGLIAYAFVMVFLAIGLDPAEFWQYAEVSDATQAPFKTGADGRVLTEGLMNRQTAFKLIFGQGLWIIIASIVAFLVGQLTDVLVFHRLKKITGNKFIWLRATGSTLVSQLIDSFIVLFIAFYLSGAFDFQTVISIMIVNYIYKFTVAVILTPMLYVVHWGIEKYLGKERAEALAEAAHAGESV